MKEESAFISIGTINIHYFFSKSKQTGKIQGQRIETAKWKNFSDENDIWE